MKNPPPEPPEPNGTVPRRGSRGDGAKDNGTVGDDAGDFVSPAAAFADRLDEGGFFSALFDMTFTRYVTRRLAGPVYVVGLAVIALSVVYGLVTSLSVAISTGTAWGVLAFLFGVVLTVVGAMLAVLLLRVGIEMFVAIVSIAENTRPRRFRSGRGKNRE